MSLFSHWNKLERKKKKKIVQLLLLDWGLLYQLGWPLANGRYGLVTEQLGFNLSEDQTVPDEYQSV